MNDTGYIVGFICMAFVIASLLAFGTLTMSRLYARQQRAEERAASESRHDHGEHHHWYDRFHHAA